MGSPRFHRRKEDRPQEITAAAFEVFAEKGYAKARVAEVATRAGVSKGLLYLYFETKQALFKAVIRSVAMRRIDALLLAVEQSELSAEAFIRGPLVAFMKGLPKSPVAIVIRLLIAEGQRHPDLVDYYWENVVSKGLGVMTELLERGVRNGEFKQTSVTELPQLIIAPALVSVIWRMLFDSRDLDTDRLIETQIDMLLAYVKT